MNITTVIGARPQFIKASVLSREFKKTDNSKKPIRETIIHTGQHFDTNMSQNFFKELGIPEPKCNLGIGGGTNGENTGRMMEKIEAIFIKNKPDYLLVYGDTDSTLAATISASKLKIPIIHIEAGLRSFIKSQPEEINRIITDHLSDICFVPSENSKKNLLAEGINEKKIFVSGDVMIDAIRIFSDIRKDSSEILKSINLEPKKYILATVHRFENINNFDKLNSILRSFGEIDLPVIFPLHPGTKKRIHNSNLDYLLNQLIVIDPIGYSDLAILQNNASIIITDSGGIQKEAYVYNVPCITLRDQTEWTELVDSGWNMLVDASNSSSIIEAYRKQKTFRLDSSHPNFYGDGFSASKIINFLQKLKN